jgi:hypothetical protein
MQTTKITKGDTLLPLNALITLDGNPVDLSAYTVKFRMVEKLDTTAVIVNDGTTGVTAHPTQTFTVDTSENLVKTVAHGVKENQQIVVSNSGGGLPAGLAVSTRYFAKDVTPNDFKVSLRPGGAEVDITTAGTGTHSFYIVGSVQYDWQTTDTDAAGDFYAWFRLFTGSERQTVPFDGASWLVTIEQSY